jgi:8-oxo-dGTP diphosphatase
MDGLSEKGSPLGAQRQGADAIHGRWLTIPRTLSFVLNGSDVLLMKRAAHKRVFPNQYNGVGGHIERGEDPCTSAIREIEEETGLQVHDVRLRAVYNIDAGAETGIMLFVFTAFSDSRVLAADESEGTLHWVPVDQIAALDLVEDLPLIIPRVVNRTPEQAPLFIHVSYDAQDRIRMRFAGED